MRRGGFDLMNRMTNMDMDSERLTLLGFSKKRKNRFRTNCLNVCPKTY